MVFAPLFYLNLNRKISVEPSLFIIEKFYIYAAQKKILKFYL